MRNGWRAGLVIPAFNIPYLPMMEPIVRALRDTGSFGLITVARLEWMKFGARSIQAIYDEYQRLKDERYTRLHLDHVPVIDEDGLTVDFQALIQEAIHIGYQSVMVDGSRLPLGENIAATKSIAEMAHAAGIPVEGELGAVLGHEAGPLPPYDELYSSGKGFTDPAEAARFVRETGVDWLSVAVGNIHGAISGAAQYEKKIQARLNIEHLQRIRDAVGIPLVLHGGSGIQKKYVLESVRHGIAKINVGMATRQAYGTVRQESVAAGQKAVYETTVRIINEELEIAESAHRINPQN
jgi:ketose-bisphosphate aldolase